MSRLSNGTRVAIRPTKRYGNEFVGCPGTIVCEDNRMPYNNCYSRYSYGQNHRASRTAGTWVKVHGHRNPCYDHGYYWFYDDELQIIGAEISGANAPSVTVPTAVKILHSDPHTIVFWDDGTHTMVKCNNGDEYDEAIGFSIALAKKIYGSYGEVKRAAKAGVK